MFEREIQKAKDHLTKLLATDGQFLYWYDLYNSTAVPIFYKNFFGAEVQWWIFEQQMMRAANPRFDAQHEQLAFHYGNVDYYLVESARFDAKDLASTTDLAVKTRFNYILRPRTTLRWFIYRGEPTKPLQEVLLRLDYFSEYEYLLSGFRKWAERKQHEQTNSRQEIVSVVEFDRVLQTVDNELILEMSPAQFIGLLTPIFDIFREIYGQEHYGKIPVPALIIFLDDKGIHRIAQEVEELLKSGMRFISEHEFLKILSDFINKLEREEQGETTMPPAPTDPLTLPLDFKDPNDKDKTAFVMKAEDTIGEIAIGKHKRKGQTVQNEHEAFAAPHRMQDTIQETAREIVQEQDHEIQQEHSSNYNAVKTDSLPVHSLRTMISQSLIENSQTILPKDTTEEEQPILQASSEQIPPPKTAPAPASEGQTHAEEKKIPFCNMGKTLYRLWQQ